MIEAATSSVPASSRISARPDGATLMRQRAAVAMRAVLGVTNRMGFPGSHPAHQTLAEPTGSE